VTRIAVWGASGFAGSHLCGAAEAQGWQVRRLGRTGIDLTGVQVAFHCAGKVAEPDAAGYVAAATEFARACAAARVRRLVYLGTVAVYGARVRGIIGKDAPLLGSGAYAESRIEAELAIQAALSGTDTAWSIVRVPMLVGPGMQSKALARFFGALRFGIFPHPGPEDAALACVGVRRFAQLMLRLPDEGNATWQFADHLRWAELARRKRAVRIRLPRLPGRFRVLSSTVRYADDSVRLAGDFSSTWDDVELLIRP
jgi:nucleoside-diphosphate-sugar epimerase